jgi:hypothetical protein
VVLHNDKSVSAGQQYDSIKAVNQAVIEQVAKDIDTDPAEAEKLLNEDPHLRHATIDKLNKMGSFEDDPAAKQYVSDYMKAGADRIPEYLGVTKEAGAVQDKSTPETKLEDNAVPTPSSMGSIVQAPSMPSM